ncbi:FAD-dependent oxidoreductase [Piscinibacter aquaticus]|uniref:FAD-dependent oxidoreductase n=1 Tax=Piscinibacter aquaticus TaxID=392597 RepID=A0A5C6U6X2_9BURK|nr:FAD-dependent oxidoreductase [Piscinibacter aquaticus]
MGLIACARDGDARWTARWVGASHERGHRLRDAKSGSLPAPAVTQRAGVLIAGGGIAGLAAARELRRAGIDDIHLFELEDAPGGNSRGHAMGGIGCPLGAHYLPTPGEAAHEVAEWLEELGLRRTEPGRVVYDERHLCHAPQERLFIDGAWHDGLLPPVEALTAGEREPTLAQYRRFSAAVQRWVDTRAFSIPTARAAWTAELAALDALTFGDWLAREGFDAPALRWYLDYCCRDDYGAGSAQVSAWAGLHYFASRHGFHAPGDDAGERDGVTPPEGNGWLAARLAAPLGERLHGGCAVLRVSEGRGEVELELWNEREQRVERWVAPQLVLALPLFVAARVIESPSGALVAAATAMRHAPWLVANLHCDRPPIDRGGAPPSWDNVLYRSPALGYVDAMHQSLRPHPGETVFTAYWALGGDDAAQAASARRALIGDSAEAWATRVLADLVRAHPDLPRHLKQVDLMRYGHAMSIPVPGLRGHAALRELQQPQRRIHFAHADLSGYSVFEEAFFHGHRAAAQLRAAFTSASVARSRADPPAPRG